MPPGSISSSISVSIILLIDEAQDTSSKQWEIVRRAGGGIRRWRRCARPGTRTIFAVGDEKQSIFSFQNAAPREFAEMRRIFQKRHRRQRFDIRVPPTRTFLPVLRKRARRGRYRVQKYRRQRDVGSRAAFRPHIALPDAPPGAWKSGTPSSRTKRRTMEGWDAPFDTVSETSPRVKFARRIARTVRG